ncbi:replicase [Circovirus sp.]|nr:replicase [Circovirus sp.]QRV11703.1 replicase [Bat associated circovirus]
MSFVTNVCFTLNNYSDGEYKNLLESDCWGYIIIGKEVGEVGTPHLQGYGELKTKKRFTTLKTKFPRVHWEQRRASADAAINYCKKEGNYVERGAPKENVSQKTAADAIKRVKGGENMRTLVEQPPSLSGIRMCQLWFQYNEKKRDFKSEVYWYWGESGTGKTRAIAEECRDGYWHDGTKWFDGYDAHEEMILDDFRGSNMKFNFLLKLLDRYPLRLEYKGGYRQMLSKKIYISSIKHPREVYNITEQEEPVKQLLRRITVIKKFVCLCLNRGNTSTIQHSDDDGIDVCGNN